MSEIKTIIGICGGSGSGKTSLVKKLSENYDASEVTVLSMDDYYKKLEHQQLDEEGIVNFDLPSAIEIDRIINDIQSLKEGKEVKLEEYTFNNPSLIPENKVLKPGKVLVVEGIFLLYFEEVLNELDFSVYIDVAPEIQLERRMKRDFEVRGYSKEQIIYQWENHVLPCFENYIEPFISKADIIVDNNGHGEFNIQPILDQILISTA